MGTTRSARVAGLAWAWLAVTGACSGESASSSTHWIRCAQDLDCQNVPRAVACTGGYCVDADGNRLTVQGGASSGGAGSAGSPGSGGGPAAAGTGGGTPKCSTAADCLLLTDCCNCVVVPSGTPPPVTCAGECFVDMCTNIGITVTQADVGCWQGFCVPLADPGNCDAAEVTCNGVAPTCPAGYDYPSVINGCWGPCVVNGSCLSTG